MKKNHHHNRPFDAEEKEKMKQELPPWNESHNVDKVQDWEVHDIRYQNPQENRVVQESMAGFNFKSKRISSETLTKAVIVLWPGRKSDWNSEIRLRVT
jgi:DUF4097 and DUF4098 domain-containing protein YvlB